MRISVMIGFISGLFACLLLASAGCDDRQPKIIAPTGALLVKPSTLKFATEGGGAPRKDPEPPKEKVEGEKDVTPPKDGADSFKSKTQSSIDGAGAKTADKPADKPAGKTADKPAEKAAEKPAASPPGKATDKPGTPPAEKPPEKPPVKN